MEKKHVEIADISPRDGFQNVGEFIETKTKIKIVEGLIEAGLKRIQLTSFVSPKAIPQMCDAGELCSYFLNKYPQIDFFVLVPNAIGMERAVEAGVREISMVISVSEKHNMANVRRTVSDSFSELAVIREKYPDVILNLDAAMAFGSPFEEKITMEAIQNYVGRAVKIGVDSINLCDTVGLAVPTLVESTLEKLFEQFGDDFFDIHIHDTRNMGMINTYTAIKKGVRRVQTTLGGLGGCPFAPGATGNTATEDLVYMLERMGYETGIDFEKLMETARFLKESVPGNYSGHQIMVNQK